MRIKYWIPTLLASISMSLQPVLAAKKVETDHPLLTPYAGSSIYSKDVKQYDEYRVFKGWDKETKKYNTQMLEGKVTKILYTNPPGRSVLELYRNYQNALKKEGVSVVYECNQSNLECVDGYVGANLRRQFGINAIGNKVGRLMFAKLDQDEQAAYLLLAVGEKYSDVHVVEIKKMDTGQVALNLAALTEGLDKQGFVVLEGIYFDTDMTELKAESRPAIDEVVKLLKERPNLKLYVIGHTDMLGSLSHNMALSGGRASAVVNVLVNEHGVSQERLEGKGIGPLAPVASNTQEDGRGKNRRVVLVQR
jgi:OOP family OmpA-OmpF porin